MNNQETLARYKFDAPLLITDIEFIKLDTEKWESGSAWVNHLSHIGNHDGEYGKLLGIVIPLELKSGSFARQDLLGVELLTWLRWSAPSPLKELPVLIVAFQPLEKILQCTLNLLLVSSGTRFVRLPDARESIKEFDKEIRDANQKAAMRFCASDLDRIAGAGGGVAEAVTHHDLANNFYSAYRLWEGYKSALVAATRGLGKRDAKVIEAALDELNREGNNLNKWKKEKIDPLLEHPHIQQYLALAKKRPSVPLYPFVEQGDQVILRHVKEGLPSMTRILIVDDEFDKGFGEVLLQILFGQPKDSYIQNGDAEWIYSEETTKGDWARLVCVKSADLATHWLTYWGNLKVPKSTDDQYKKWYGNWATTLNVSLSLHGKEAAPRDALERVDNPHAQPKGANTVVLLDIRLEAGEQREPYAPQELSSMKLLNLIKQQENPVPVIMSTASRQAMNYAIAMESASMFDGWLTKEGPDMSLDNTNSTRAVHYLLERLHEFACTHEWYREELEWEPKWKREYSKLRSHPKWEDNLSLVAKVASNLFSSIKNETFRANYELYCVGNSDNSAAAGLGWADDWGQYNYTDVFTINPSLERRLVLRRVIVAALLETANWSAEAKPTWNCEKFNNLIPGKDGRKKVSAVYQVVTNFNEKLWLTTNNPKLFGMLLREEYEWLLNQFPINTQASPKHDYLLSLKRDRFPEELELQ